jgi:hypothetical protein
MIVKRESIVPMTGHHIRQNWGAFPCTGFWGSSNAIFARAKGLQGVLRKTGVLSQMASKTGGRFSIWVFGGRGTVLLPEQWSTGCSAQNGRFEPKTSCSSLEREMVINSDAFRRNCLGDDRRSQDTHTLSCTLLQTHT